MRAIALGLTLLLLGLPAAQAQNRPPSTLDREAEETARAFRDALERAMRLMDNFVGSIPQYQLPEVLPNGDIIIRRIPSPEPRFRPRFELDPSPDSGPPQRPAPPPTPRRAPSDPKMEET